MTTWTRLAAVALTTVGLVGLASEAAAQCVTLRSGTPTMIVLNPLQPQAQPAVTTTTTAQGTTITSATPGATEAVTPAGGDILTDGRVVPASAVAGTTSSYTPGSYLTPGSYHVDAYGNVVYPSQPTGSTYYWPGSMYPTTHYNGAGMYYTTPYVTYGDSSASGRRGLLRRR